MTVQHPSLGRRRLAAGAITLAAHALLLVMLIALGQGRLVRPVPVIPSVTLTELPPPSPPPPSPPPRHREGAPKSPVRAPSVSPHPAPPSPAPVAPPPPVVALPVAAPVAPGTGGSGTGGEGNGNGAGGGGSGGNGAGDGLPPQHVKGRIRDSDYPRDLSDAGISGTVGVRYRVGVDGRVTGCIVTHSSGSRELDAHTCDLIEQRFRFRPSRDSGGRPVPSIIVENHSWLMLPPPPDAESGSARQ